MPIVVAAVVFCSSMVSVQPCMAALLLLKLLVVLVPFLSLQASGDCREGLSEPPRLLAFSSSRRAGRVGVACRAVLRFECEDQVD